MFFNIVAIATQVRYPVVLIQLSCNIVNQRKCILKDSLLVTVVVDPYVYFIAVVSFLIPPRWPSG